MNKFCVIAKNKNTYFIKRLIEKVGQMPVFDPWSDHDFPVAEKYIVRTTGIYRNDLDLMMIKAQAPEKVVNSYNVLNRFRTKTSQYYWFEDNNFSSLPWIPVKGTDLVTIEKFFRLYPEAVVKPVAGQGGWGIEVLTWDKFKSWKKKKGTDEDYLLQPFIKNATELRYFFIKGQDPIVMERSAKTGIAANFQRQGSATLTNLPEEYRAEVEMVIQKSGAHYGALDLLIKDGVLSILELNSVPGIEQLEKVSGQNVIQKFLTSLNS
jgi:glutathione synthase/RimK-type ligase-like ATP-grasp enzyme